MATAPGKDNPRVPDGPVDVASCAEPPRDHDASLCRDYKVQLLRDKYRLPAERSCPEMDDIEMGIREFDSIARVVGESEVSVSIQMVRLRPSKQRDYSSHVIAHTRVMEECIERGFRKIKGDKEEIAECIAHMGERLEYESQCYGYSKGHGDTFKAASPKHSDMPNHTAHGDGGGGV